MSRRLWIGGLALAGVLSGGLPPVAPRLPLPAALVVGAAAGALLYAVLVRRLPRPIEARCLAFLPALAVGAAVEELVWRGFFLGALLRLLHPVGALAVSSAGFAYAHPRRAPHLLTGATFGAVYLGSGQLGAACTAHTLYNWLVALSSRSSSRAAPDLDSRRPAAELRGVSKAFGTTEALRELNLELQEGQVVALLGRNGAGKSTAVSILLGLRRPDSGEARLAGLDPCVPEARTSIGCVAQEVGFPASLRVQELIDLVRTHHRHARPRQELLDRFGLAALARRQAGGLSGGERRRLAVALAFAGAPKTLFLDEPTAGLDVEARQALWDEVRAHAAAGGAVLLTTHYLEEAEALATEVVLLDAGSVVARGAPAELRAGAGLTSVRLRATELPPLAAAERIERMPGGSAILAADAGELVRELVAKNVDLAGLEIDLPPLEQALVRLRRGEGDT